MNILEQIYRKAVGKMLAKLYNIALGLACIFRGRWASVYDVTIREGVEPYLMVVIPSYVSCLAWRRTSQGVEVLLERVFRQAAGTVWEPCEGVPRFDESDLEAIQRELEEEAGLQSADVVGEPVYLYRAYKATDRALAEHPVIGQELVPTVSRLYLVEIASHGELGEQRLDAEEEIVAHWVTLPEAIRAVREEAQEHGLNSVMMLLLKELEDYVK